MALIHDNVFDAALNHVKSNADTVEVRNASSAVLANTALDASNYTGPADYTSGSVSGRKLLALKSSTNDMKSISVSGSGGNATKVVLKDASPAADLIVASITSAPVTLGGSDKVNLGTFSIILKDPS
jgi:hypothetical protein